jgi:hypothetical protein
VDATQAYQATGTQASNPVDATQDDQASNPVDATQDDQATGTQASNPVDATQDDQASNPVDERELQLRTALATLQAMGLDTAPIQAQLDSLADKGIKTKVYSHLNNIRDDIIKLNKGFSVSVENGILVITYNEGNQGNSNASAKLLLNIKGEKGIYNKGPWIPRLLADIKKIPEYRNKEESWMKDNREPILSALTKANPEKYSIPA